MSGWTLLVPCSKSGRPRLIQLNSAALELLRSLPRQPGNAFIFPSPVTGRPSASLHFPWTRIRKRAGPRVSAARSAPLVREFSSEQGRINLHRPRFIGSHQRARYSAIRAFGERDALARCRAYPQRRPAKASVGYFARRDSGCSL